MYDSIVLGAGIVGVNTAYWLARKGHKTLVVDRQPGPALETSFANGGQISVSHAEPWANPSAPLKVLQWLLKPDAPLLFRPRMDPHQWQWLVSWLYECLPARSRKNTVDIVKLATFSRDMLQQVRARHDLQYEQKTQGILHFYRDQKEYDSAIPVADLMREYGCNRRVVSKEEVLEIEPTLKHIKDDIVGATYTAEDESGNAQLYTTLLADVAAGMGTEFAYSSEIMRLEKFNDSKGESVRVVIRRRGKEEILEARNVVVCMGSFSPQLLRPLGINLNIYPAKGYSITVPLENPDEATTTSLTDDQFKLVYSRLGNKLRVAGTAELSGYDQNVVKHRCEAIVNNVRKVFPLAGGYDQAQFWAGLRPTTPSNMPYLGQTRYKNLWLNTGHGTLGWTMGCGSGKVVADLISEGRSDYADFKVGGLSMA